MHFHNFRAAYGSIMQEFRSKSELVPAHIWQGLDVSSKPEMATHELEDYIFSFPLATEVLEYHRAQIGPNLPWADRHFELDRVSGEPLNPGFTWQEWPYALKADSFRDEHGQFNHSYAERYWPKLANLPMLERSEPHTGIRYRYGDLNDVVNLLVRNPLTRNAYLPVWYPEDTGVVHGGRTPCSIGYLFRMRQNRLSVFYDIRSCDFVRHFQDDVYLTVRLLLWVLAQARSKDKKWDAIKTGTFTMHIGSFHIFANDWQRIMG